MSLRNNTTIAFTGNGTTLDQHNSTCVFAIDSNTERISKVCALCFILLGSFSGNIFIIIIVYKNRDLRKTINYFIVNMAVSDLLFPLILLPDQITQMVTESWNWRVSGILGSTYCKLDSFTSQVSLFVSVQSLVWIAIDRFVAVVFPIKLGLISGKIRTMAIVSTWILASVFYFPLLVTSGLAEHGNKTFCRLVSRQSIFPNNEAIEVYHWLHLTIRYFAPLFLMTFLYSAIAIVLKRGKQALTDASSNVPGQRCLKKRRQATQMAVVILVLFYICVIPATLFPFVQIWRQSCAFSRSFYFIAIFMLYFSSVVNPIICLSFVESYRHGLKNILCYFCGIRVNKKAKCERITLKGIRNLPRDNCQETSKETDTQ